MVNGLNVEVIGVIEDYRMTPYILEEGSRVRYGKRPMPDVFEFRMA